MTETAAAVAGAVTGKTVVLTGAMIPYAFGSSDGLFNLGQRALVRAGTASRSLHCHTRSMLSLGPRPEKPRARRVRGNSAGLSAKSQVHLNASATPVRLGPRTSDFALRLAAHTMRHAKNYSDVVVR